MVPWESGGVEKTEAQPLPWLNVLLFGPRVKGQLSHPREPLVYTRGEQGLEPLTMGSKSTGQTQWNILDTTPPHAEVIEFPSGTTLPPSSQPPLPAQPFA